MASLFPPFNTLSVGKHTLQAKEGFLGWHTIGTCNVVTDSDFNFAASGNYNAFLHSGTFDLKLELTDHDPSAPTGPCVITNAGQALTGTYTKNGSTISFSDGVHTVTASPDPAGIILQISGYPELRVNA